MIRRSVVLPALALSALPLAAHAAYESAPVQKASQILPIALVSGPKFKVAEQVPTDGFMPKYTLQSDFGPFEAEGREMLEVRVHEVHALAQLDEISKGEAFANAMGQSAKKTGKAVAHAATNPAETVKGVPQGVGRMFKGLGGKAKKGAEAAGDAVAGDDAEEGEGKSAGQAAGDAAMSVTGANKSKRAWAKKYEVDPYSTNPALQKKLDELATASTAGGLAVSILNPIPFVGTVASVNSMVWDMPAPDLQKLHDGKLAKLGVSAPTRKAFFGNPHFTPTQDAGFVGALETLAGVTGAEKVVALATRKTRSEDDARFYRRAAQILAQYQKTVGPLASLEARTTLFVARARSGALVVPAPVDLVCWTDVVDTFTAAPELAAPKREIWLSGRATDQARKEITARGWVLKESVFGP